MDNTKKKGIVKKLEDLFRRRPARKELIQRNILQPDSSIDEIEVPKQRKPLLIRLMSKSGKEQMSEGVAKVPSGGRTTLETKQTKENKRSKTVSAVPTAPNSLHAVTPLSVSSPAVVYERNSYLPTEDDDFKLPGSPSSPRTLAPPQPPSRSMSVSGCHKSTLELASGLEMNRSRSASSVKSTKAANLQSEIASPPKSPSWTNRSPTNASVRTYIDGGAKFSTLPTKMSPSNSPPSRILRGSLDGETILKEQCKQSSKLNVHANMIFVKTPVMSSPLADCPTPFFDQLMMLDDSDM